MTERRAVLAVLVLGALLASSCRHAALHSEKSVQALGRYAGVRAILEESVARGEIAGAVALVARNGEAEYYDAVGVADIDAPAPMARDAIFRIASMTKPVTSVAVMVLRDEGKLELTDPVSKYIPELRQVRVLAGGASEDSPSRLASPTREITIHHLLTHTSGITYEFTAPPELARFHEQAHIPSGLMQTDGTIGEMVVRLAGVPLAHQPGERWTYGLSIDVLGRVVEVASGMSLDDFFRTRIFEPLGMTDTHFFLPPEKRARLAALHAPVEGGGIEKVGDEPVTRGGVRYSASFHYSGPKTYFSGGAGLVSTARDYSRFLLMLLGGGELDGARILRPETVAMMTSNRIGELEIGYKIHGDRFGYGFGVLSGEWKQESGAPEAPGSYSWGGIFHTYFWVDPQEELIGLVLTQLFPFGHLSLWADYKRAVYDTR